MLSLLLQRVGDAEKVMQERRSLQRQTGLQAERLRILEARHQNDLAELKRLRDQLQRFALVTLGTGREVV